MRSERMVALTDGVIAVIITIMVLDLRPPPGADLTSLRSLAGTLAAYVISFVFIGIYWNNHHHLMRAADGIDGRAMWANLHLLFWLSLAPFTTAWLGEHPLAAGPTALYSTGLLMDAVAFTLLQRALIAVSGPTAALAATLAADRKGNLSLLLYVCAIGMAFVWTPISDLLIIIVAVLWVVPDRRFEAIIAGRQRDADAPVSASGDERDT
jgi:uncharacterized membrane protein